MNMIWTYWSEEKYISAHIPDTIFDLRINDYKNIQCSSLRENAYEGDMKIVFRHKML